ncbi:hypothetical protein ACW9UR_23350 [Halovulum sp. GXIMD14794]
MTDPVLATLLAQNEHRKVENSTSLKHEIVAAYRAVIESRMMPVHMMESLVAEAGQEIDAWLSLPAADTGSPIPAETIASEVEKTRGLAGDDPADHRRMVRRNLGLLGYGRSDITALDPLIRRLIAGDDVEEQEPASEATVTAHETGEALHRATEPEWAGPTRAEVPGLTRILEVLLADDPEGRGLTPFGMAKRIAHQRGAFEVLSALATAADRERAERSSIDKIRDRLRQETPAIDAALDRCTPMPGPGMVVYPIPSALVPLALTKAVSKNEIARCVDDGEFALDDMFLFREQEAREALARQADRILEDLKGATVTGWTRRLPYMLATRQAQVAELEARLRDLQVEYRKEHSATVSAPPAAAKAAQSRGPSPRRKNAPTKPVPQPRRAALRVEKERGLSPMGLVAALALLAIVGSALVWRQEIFDGSGGKVLSATAEDPAPTAPEPKGPSAEEIEEQERLYAVERRIDTIIRGIETASVTIPDCGETPPLPQEDSRAAFDAFDGRHKEMGSCLNAAAAGIEAETAELKQLLAELRGILDELWDRWPEETKGDAIKRLDGLAQTISSKIAPAREAYRQQKARWTLVLNSRNVLLNDMTAAREQRRAYERAERLRAENRRREAILDERQRQAWRDELAWSPRDLSWYDPMLDPTSKEYREFMSRSEQAYYGIQRTEPSASSSPRKGGSSSSSGSSRSASSSTATSSSAPRSAPERKRGPHSLYLAVADGVVSSQCNPYNLVQEYEEELPNCEDKGIVKMQEVNWAPCRSGVNPAELTEVTAFKVMLVSGLTARARDALTALDGAGSAPPYAVGSDYYRVIARAQERKSEIGRSSQGVPSLVADLSTARAWAGRAGCELVESYYKD